jgi:hypothetical protein
VLDLQTNSELLELLRARLRRREYDALAMAEYSASVGLPELVDQVEQLAKGISDIIIIPEVMAGRIAYSGPIQRQEKRDDSEAEVQSRSPTNTECAGIGGGKKGKVRA